MPDTDTAAAPQIVRAATVSIVPHDGIDWPELWTVLHESWNGIGRAANAAMRQYIAADRAETETGRNGKLRLLPLPASVSKAAYDAARTAAPAIPSGCISDICQRVRARYLADRWAVQLAIRKSVPTFARPLPLSIRRQDWHLSAMPDGDKPRNMFLVRFPLPGMLRDARPTFRLVLRTGRDAQLLQRICDGDYDRRTLEVLPPGWVRKGAIRAKVVYARERKPAHGGNGNGGTLYLATGHDHLLTARVGAAEAAEVWHWNLDWLRGRIGSYDRWRERHAEDCKHERRVPRGRRETWRNDCGRRAEKHGNRVRTAIQQIVAQVVGLAARQGCGTIQYNDTDRTWIDSFPWCQMETSLIGCAEQRGVAVETANAGRMLDGRPHDEHPDDGA